MQNINTTEERIKLSPFLANHFSADYLDDVPEGFIINNYESTQNILENPDKFPKANFAYCEQLVEELAGWYFTTPHGVNVAFTA